MQKSCQIKSAEISTLLNFLLTSDVSELSTFYYKKSENLLKNQEFYHWHLMSVVLT